MSDRVLILGASGRAAAASARRAGFEPIVIDLFADADTRCLAQCFRCEFADYPQGLFDLARQLPSLPWLYVGGLENEPARIETLAADRPLWGNRSSVLAKVRDPFDLHSLLQQHGFATPACRRPGEPRPGDRRWLCKPLSGTGGKGIRWAEPDPPGDLPGSYAQAYVPGPAMAAIFAGGQDGGVLLGVSRQLIGSPWLHAAEFQYAGSLGVAEVPERVREELLQLGDLLVREAGLRGLFGIDFILGEGRPWLIEVNPRYTASVEVLELGGSFAALAWHAWGCGQRPRPPAIPDRPHRIVGKGIYYAADRLRFPASGPWEASRPACDDLGASPAYADLPHPGEIIEPGPPVLTILTGAESESECLIRLQSTAANLDRLFGFRAPAEDEPCRP